MVIGRREKQVDLLAALKENPRDQTLWEQFYRRLRPSVYYVVFRLTGGNVAIAEDITQETFLTFLQRADIGRFPDESKVRAFLHQVARNHVLSFRSKAHNRLVNSVSDAAASALDNLPDSNDEQELEVIKWDLEQLASGLSDDERALLAQLVKDRSIDEIARALDLSYGATAVRIFRLRKRLLSKINVLEEPA